VLPDDDPLGPKHVGVTLKLILTCVEGFKVYETLKQYIGANSWFYSLYVVLVLQACVVGKFIRRFRIPTGFFPTGLSTNSEIIFLFLLSLTRKMHYVRWRHALFIATFFFYVAGSHVEKSNIFDKCGR
jgi:hypothetical protein